MGSIVAGAVLLTPAVARSQDPEQATSSSQLEGTMARRGPQLGARVGYAAGAGAVHSGLAVSDTSSGGVPVVVDAGWRFLPHLYAGLYGQVAPVILKTDPVGCPDGFSCSALDWRFGAQVDVHFLPRLRWDPYAGVGAGYEILHETQSGTMNVPAAGGPMAQSFQADVTERGWEFASLTLGFDYRVSDVFGVGPFLTGTVSEYNVESGHQSFNGATMPLPPVTPAGHELFFAGVRGTVNP